MARRKMSKRQFKKTARRINPVNLLPGRGGFRL